MATMFESMIGYLLGHSTPIFAGDEAVTVGL
jgi:hypothetical protein